LFDNPWMVAVVVIVGALVNWLSKRREEKQAGPPTEGEEPSPSAGKPPGALTLEETLRRLMGEEPPAPMPAPPPIPDAARGGSPPAPDWEKEEPFEPVRQTVPPSRPPLPAVAQASVSAIATTVREQAEAARRFEQFNEQGRHPATVVGHGRGYRSHAGKRAAVRWRDPRSARQGFVASLVFGPPKSLEP
jgi:hypothetical protein